MDDLMVRMADLIRRYIAVEDYIPIGLDHVAEKIIAEYDALKAQPAFVKSGSESGQKACANGGAWRTAVDQARDVYVQYTGVAYGEGWTQCIDWIAQRARTLEARAAAPDPVSHATGQEKET